MLPAAKDMGATSYLGVPVVLADGSFFGNGVNPPGDYGNNIVLASREPIQLHGGVRPFVVPPWMGDQIKIQPPLELSGSSIVLDDDYNPLDLWAVAASEKWRTAAIAMYPKDVLFAE